MTFEIRPDEPTAEALRHYYELVRKQREIHERASRAQDGPIRRKQPYIDQLVAAVAEEIDNAAYRVIDALGSVPAVKAIHDEVMAYPDAIADEAVTDDPERST